MKLDTIYKKLNSIFVEYTINNWKNDWQNEADINSKSLIVKNFSKNHNLFLLRKTKSWDEYDIVTLQGIDKFNIEIKCGSNTIRIDIECDERDIFYYVDYDNWLAEEMHILELCKAVYESKVRLRKVFETIPIIYGETNPDFLKQYKRQIRLDEIL